MGHRIFMGRSSKDETPTVRSRRALPSIGLIGYSAACLALALGMAGGCDPPDPEPGLAPVAPCTYRSEVEVAHGELIREPGNPWVHTTLTTEAGVYVFEFHLDGMPAAEARIDGEKLNLAAGVSVNDDVDLRFELTLAAGSHEISLRVAGPPGGKLGYSVARVIASGQPAITDNFTVRQGQASVHTLCGGTSTISFADNALQVGDQELNITVHCESAACTEGGASLASPRLVFDTPNNGYQFRTAPVLEHPTTSSSVRELDGVPIGSEDVGSLVIDGAAARVLRSRIWHFSTVEDRDLDPWCREELTQLNASTSVLCYSTGNEPGVQFRARCTSVDGGVTATASEVTPCGVGPDSCRPGVGEGVDASCNPANTCQAQAYEACHSNPCLPLVDDSQDSPSHKLRCNEPTSQVFVGVRNTTSGECELRGDDLLRRDEQVKTVLAATYGPGFEVGIEQYLAPNPTCAQDAVLDQNFVDYSTWKDKWSANILKFAICVGILKGREQPDAAHVAIAPGAPVQQAEMAAMMVRAGSVGPLALPDNTQLAPHPRMVALNQHYVALENTSPPLPTHPGCGDDEWFFTQPVVQAVMDKGVMCHIDAHAPMDRKLTASWLYNLTLGAMTCDSGSSEVSCKIGKQSCRRCKTVESCQTLLESIIGLVPDYAKAAKDGNRQIKFVQEGVGACQTFGNMNEIHCPKTLMDGDWVTNKLLFHELNHALREAKIDSVGGYGNCSNGSCSSGEFQASLLEGYYFPGSDTECPGGTYDFTDTNGVVRAVADLNDKFREQTEVPEDKLWDYAMGREDTLAGYLTRFGDDIDATEDLYYSQAHD